MTTWDKLERRMQNNIFKKDLSINKCKKNKTRKMKLYFFIGERNT